MALPPYIKQNIAKNDPSYIYVELANHSLKKNDILELVKFLKANTYITTLNLQRNNLTSDMIDAFAELPLNIRSVLLAQNNLDDDCADDIIKYFKTVESLDISYNSFSNKMGKKLAESASQFHLKVIGNDIDESYLGEIAARAQQNRKMQKVQLDLVEQSTDDSETSYHTFFKSTQI